MSVTNDFVPFCGTDTGTNLLSQSAYLSDPQLAIGNQTGVARSMLVNKVLRQASFVAAGMAQLAATATQTSTQDDANSAQFLAQLQAALLPVAPYCTSLTTIGSATWNLPYAFFCSSVNATVGATYSNNSVTFTVLATVAASAIVQMSGGGVPTAGGTLTKVSGTGDATITFYASRAALYYKVGLVGSGGGGSGSGTSGAGNGGLGGNTTFGPMTANGGGGGVYTANTGGAGGTVSLGSGPQGLVLIQGQTGGGPQFNTISATALSGGAGGSSVFSGGGLGTFNAVGQDASTFTGSGGSGGAAFASANEYAGTGGGAGGYILASIPNPTTTYAYTISAGGTVGTAGTAGDTGGAGAQGMIALECHFQ